jgi:hypothetical protein
MTPFVIEVYWPDMTVALVDALVARAVRAPDDERSAATYVGCTIAPRDETCFIRVAAHDEAAVRALVERLGLASARVAELVDVPSPSDRRRDPPPAT